MISTSLGSNVFSGFVCAKEDDGLEFQWDQINKTEGGKYIHYSISQKYLAEIMEEMKSHNPSLKVDSCRIFIRSVIEKVQSVF